MVEEYIKDRHIDIHLYIYAYYIGIDNKYKEFYLYLKFINTFRK